MKALVLKDFNEMVVADRETPTAGRGEILLRTVATGICGSDLHGFTGANGRRHPGQVMGHETVGRVAAIGDGVVAPPDAGSIATINPVISCGGCAACASGAEQHCATKRVVGVDPTLSAAFAEYVAVPAGNVVPLPDAMPEEYGALIEPLAVGYHAARRGGIDAADTVLVLGGGPIGQTVVLAARRLGARRVLVSEPNAGRRRLCASLGADVIDPSAGSVPDQVRDVFGGPASVAVDAVGVSATVADALTATLPGAHIVLVGMGTPRIDLGAFAISTGERSLIGTFSYPAAEFQMVAEWVAGAPDELAALIDKRVSLAEAPAAFTELASDLSVAGKVLVRY